MAMQHLRLPDIPGKFSGSTRKKGEAPILVLTAVDALGIENGMADQVHGHPIGWVFGLVDGKFSAHGLSTPDRLIWDLELAPKLAVARHDQPNVMAKLG